MFQNASASASLNMRTSIWALLGSVFSCSMLYVSASHPTASESVRQGQELGGSPSIRVMYGGGPIMKFLIRALKGNTSMTGKELVPYTEAVVVAEVSTDDTLVETWMHGLPESTQRAYRHEVRDLLDYTGKHLQDITIFDLQAYNKEKLLKKANTSRARAIAAIKSLYKRIRQAGLIAVNPAEFLRTPKVPETLAERYLTPEQVESIIAQVKK